MEDQLHGLTSKLFQSEKEDEGGGCEGEECNHEKRMEAS